MARRLLSRCNPYRGVRYADDPAIAFVEITNDSPFANKYLTDDPYAVTSERAPIQDERVNVKYRPIARITSATRSGIVMRRSFR